MDGTDAPRRSTYKSIGVALGIAALIIAAALLANRFLFHVSKFGSVGSGAGLHGQLHMTMTAAGLTGPYVFDFDRNTLIRQTRISGVLLLQAVTASRTGDVAYRCMDGQVPAVCVYHPKTAGSSVVSRNAFPLKRYLAWSPDEKSMLYVAYLGSTTPPTTSDPNEWGVYLARADGRDEMKIATGSVAFFSPDATSVYSVQANGLHKHDLSSGKDTVAWPVTGGPADRFMMLVVSRDGKKLAWSSPYSSRGRGSLVVYDISNWHPLTLRQPVELSMRVWQMQFSPDGSALALSADDPDGHPALYVYVPGREPRQLLDLSAYDRQTFLSEW